ncbi:MAG: two-component system sensor histidine kinase NtrB [Candidatus Aminicenantia bacterium]
MEYQKKLNTLIIYRFIVATTLLGSAIIIQVVSPFLLKMDFLYYLIFSIYILNILYIIFLKINLNNILQLYIQIFGDVAIITWLVYISGGMVSPFYFLYILPIIVSSFLLPTKGLWAVTFISALLFGSLVDLMYYKIIPPYNPFETDIPQELVLYNLFISAFAFFSTAYLSSILSRSLKKADRELKIVEERFRDLEIFSRNIIENMGSGLLTAEEDGKVIFFNMRAHEILGDELLKGSIWNIFPFKKGFEEIGNKRVGFEVVVKGKIIGGNISSIENAKRPYFVFLFQDITESKKMENELKIKEKLATLGEMSSFVAHEIRNPLTAISGAAQLIKEEQKWEPELMDIIFKESKRLSDFLTEFLDTLKPFPKVSSKVDFSQVIRNCLSLVVHSRKNIIIKGNFENMSATLNADERQLRTIFWNIIVNSLKAMPEGGILEVNINNREKEVEVSIKDSGIGMGKEELQKVFEPFYSNFSNGQGIGMSLVWKLVNEMGGKIKIESSKGKGTEIVLLLPKEVL